MLSDDELLRYNRQLLLPSWDVAAQEALKSATVLVVGLGGLGCPLAHSLVMAGVGRLILLDDDVVELSNLQRQSLHIEARIGQLKVDSAAVRLRESNQHVAIEAVPERATAESLAKWLPQVDVVADCTDNFASRDLIAQCAWQAGVPLVSAAAIGWQGQLSVFDSRLPDSPCYRCVFPAEFDQDVNCTGQGVMATTVAMMGAWQAQEVMKLVTNLGGSLAGHLILWDGFKGQMRDVRVVRDPSCSLCSPSGVK